MPPATSEARKQLLTGEAALGDWTTDAPGVRRKITEANMPAPFATESAKNHPRKVAQPQGAWPQVPSGFRVEKFAEGLSNPRMIRTAPNGDLFVAESDANRIHVLRDANGDGKPEVNEVFATGLKQPFGIAFYPPGPNPLFIYIANTGSVVRFPIKMVTPKRAGPVKLSSAIFPAAAIWQAADIGRGMSCSPKTARRCTSRSAPNQTPKTIRRKHAAPASLNTRPMAKTNVFMRMAFAML
ncbi:MAG: hypothetical protein U0Y68_14580 [Blastocatellia bacterium]